MSSYRPPASCCWQSLLALPVLLFLVVLAMLQLVTPEGAHAQAPDLQAVSANTEIGPLGR